MSKSKVYNFIRWLTPIVACAAVGAFLFGIVFGLVQVPSGSMENTIPENSISIILRKPFWNGMPECGDIIVFKPSVTNTVDENSGNKSLLIKRVVGLPGDTVVIRNGITYINGERYDEPWLKEQPEDLDFGPFIVGANEVFVMGDNRNHSVDSRYWISPMVGFENFVGILIHTFNKLG